jgi:predicted site-specific integrase-resolvase
MKINNMVTSKKAVEKLGVSPNTLRRWADAGTIKTIRTPAGQRLYDVSSFLASGKERRKVIYCRVSSRNQKPDLESQVKYLRERYPNHEIIEDIGSGLNFKRKGLNALLGSILDGDVSEVVISHRDRLCRFGFDLIESIVSKYDCELVVYDESKLSPQAELVQDLLSIIHVFSCRLYGLRKYSRKIKEDQDLSQDGRSEPV